VISVAFDWASRYLALPASSPGLAVDPPEEGGFGIGHKPAMAKNEGDRASLKRRGHNFSENNRNQRRRIADVPMRQYVPKREYPVMADWEKQQGCDYICNHPFSTLLGRVAGEVNEPAGRAAA
jgi:hypothetical protein